ncbi:MAG TPA: hypothetical protein VGJ86_20810 [Acidimicrobiales bacterium]|jgi:phosphoglycolate phosphatase-like HAD superfamily hydrolase
MSAVLPQLDLGPAPIVDFDGTVARLPVDWDALRRQLGVSRIAELWTRSQADEEAWKVVSAAEYEAALVAQPVGSIVDALAGVAGFAVLTSNSVAAVDAFCDRHPALRERMSVVIGREMLRGPKTDFGRFSAGFAVCLEATAGDRGDAETVYAGDQHYELDFAHRLGARTIMVERDA